MGIRRPRDQIHYIEREPISNAATNNVRPPINPVTENIQLPDGLVIVVHVEQGISKPYMDTNGYTWVKSGSDKRRVTAREELQRMFQEAALIHADETPVGGTSVYGGPHCLDH